MRPSRSDYEAISSYYDQVRCFDRAYTEGWLDCIMRHGDLAVRRRILDVGCGTGRYTSMIAHRMGGPVVGLDPSGGMLERARHRAAEGPADLWLVRGRGEAMPIRDDAFDAAVLVLVVHHVEDLGALASELYRVLAPGGRVLVQTRDHDEIEGSYIALFPGVLEIDLARFPPVERLEARLRGAGLVGVGHAREENPSVTFTAEQVMEKVEGRFISTLAMMSDEEFARGRGVFRERLEERYGQDPIPTASFTYVWGEVPR